MTETTINHGGEYGLRPHDVKALWMLALIGCVVVPSFIGQLIAAVYLFLAGSI